MYVQSAAPEMPHAEHNGTDDDQEAYELSARGVIDPPGKDAGYADRNGKDG